MNAPDRLCIAAHACDHPVAPGRVNLHLSESVSPKGRAMSKPSLPPLDKLDPAVEWSAWKPAKSEWNTRWAAHLYRRAGFGASRPELKDAVAAGLEATVDQ